MSDEKGFLFKPAFIMEIGRKEDSCGTLSSDRVFNAIYEIVDGGRIAPDRKSISLPVETMTHDDACAWFIISNSPSNPVLSPPTATLRMPWGCLNDDISKMTVLTSLFAEQLQMTIFHDGTVIENPAENLRKVYYDTGRKIGLGVQGLLDRAGIMSSFLKPIRLFELSVRTENCLRKLNAKIAADLVNRSEEELLRSHNFGRKSLGELQEVLPQDGLRFGMTIDSALYVDIISLALPKAIIRELPGSQDGLVMDKRKLLLSLADIISMAVFGNEDTENNLSYEKRLDTVEKPLGTQADSPAVIMEKTRSEAMRILEDKSQ